MEKSNFAKLGSGIHSQSSIKADINEEKIVDFFLKNIKKFSKLNLANELQNKLLSFIEKNKSFPFKITKHIEIFFELNKNNIELVFKYFLFRYTFSLAGKNKILTEYPPYVLIELFSACNLRCPFCFQTDLSFTKKPFMGSMKFDLFTKIVDECDEIGVGALTFGSRGEPTMYKKLDEALSYARSKKNIFEIKLNTNATYLNDKIANALLSNGINQIVISADHYEKEEYEKLRINSEFNEILKNVDHLFNLREKLYKNSQTEIRVSGVNDQKNFSPEKFYDFWMQRSDHVSVVKPMERWDTYKNKPHPDINDPCENLFDRIYVWYNGDVNPCDADYKSKLSFGNLNEDTIKNIWNNKIIYKLREDHLNGNRNKHLPCDRCGVSFT